MTTAVEEPVQQSQEGEQARGPQPEGQEERVHPNGQAQQSNGGQLFGQGLQAEIAHAVQPVLGNLQEQIAETIRQQMERALEQTRDEVRQQVNRGIEPVRDQEQQQVTEALGQLQDEEPRENGRQGEGRTEGEQEQAQSPLRTALQQVVAELKQTLQWLVKTLQALLQTVRHLLMAVVRLLQSLARALRAGLSTALRPVAHGLAVLWQKVWGALRKVLVRFILKFLVERIIRAIGQKLSGAIRNMADLKGAA